MIVIVLCMVDFCVCALAMVGTHVEVDVGVSTVALHLSF